MDGGASPAWPAGVAVKGATVSLGLGGPSYDAATKRCSDVACHLAAALVWGDTATWGSACHDPHAAW